MFCSCKLQWFVQLEHMRIQVGAWHAPVTSIKTKKDKLSAKCALVLVTVRDSSVSVSRSLPQYAAFIQWNWTQGTSVVLLGAPPPAGYAHSCQYNLLLLGRASTDDKGPEVFDDSSSSSSSSSDSSMPMIFGIVAGALLLLIVTLVILFIMKKKRHKRPVPRNRRTSNEHLGFDNNAFNDEIAFSEIAGRDSLWGPWSEYEKSTEVILWVEWRDTG